MKKSVFAILMILCLLFAFACPAQEGNQADAPLDGRMEANGGPAVSAASMTTEAYLTFIREQADAIKTSLEQDALTQTDMNLKSEALRALWEEALSRLLDEAKKTLTEAEMEKLIVEQEDWAAAVQTAVETAGKEVEGGSMYPLVMNTEAARLTEERVYKLYELLK